MKCVFLVAAAVLVALTTSVTSIVAAPSQQRDDALVACLIGNAAVSLHKQIGIKVDAKAATDAAVTYANRRCKGQLPPGGDDYVYHSIRSLAKTWFDEPDEPQAQPREQKEIPKLYVLASPPTSQVGAVFKGKYYWFSRGEPEPSEGRCDLKFDNGCFMKSDATFRQISKDIISINGGKAFGCSPTIIPDTSKVPGYQSGYGRCTSSGWKSMPD
jgi:hypothetical protein